MRQAVHNFLQNLDGPVIFANDVLQGQAGLAGNTLVRLALNTTVGVGGFFDVATQIGVPYHSNDLGVTLATWGFAEGPYVIVPVLGPSNPRDLVGQVGDGFADPGDYVASEHHLIVAVVARTATPASTSARATSRPWPRSSAPRSIIMRQFARCTVSGARRRSATSSRTCRTRARCRAATARPTSAISYSIAK